MARLGRSFPRPFIELRPQPPPPLETPLGPRVPATLDPCDGFTGVVLSWVELDGDIIPNLGPCDSSSSLTLAVENEILALLDPCESSTEIWVGIRGDFAAALDPCESSTTVLLRTTANYYDGFESDPPVSDNPAITMGLLARGHILALPPAGGDQP